METMTGPKVSYKAEEEQSWDAFGQVEQDLKTLIFLTHRTQEIHNTWQLRRVIQ